MKSLVVIPARYDSTRLPGKPMLEMEGKTMIQRVFEQCKKSSADHVIVATDNQTIYEHVNKLDGCEAIMTGPNDSGTARVIEAVSKLNSIYDIIVNVQGDEPFISPDDIDSIINLVKKHPDKVATLVTNATMSEYTDRNVVKCILKNHTIFVDKFTREYSSLKNINYYKHIGIYGFSNSILETIGKMKDKTINEQSENLEQLRWKDNGVDFVTDFTPNSSIGIDTHSDYIEALKLLKNVKN